jgi:hypothetical protein
MGEESKQTYTIRIPQLVTTQLEEAARTHGITPTTLIQSLVIRKFKSRESGDRETDVDAQTAVVAKLETMRKSVERLVRIDGARFNRLYFEIVKDPLRAPAFARSDPQRDCGRPDHRGVGPVRS